MIEIETPDVFQPYEPHKECMSRIRSAPHNPPGGGYAPDGARQVRFENT